MDPGAAYLLIRGMKRWACESSGSAKTHGRRQFLENTEVGACIIRG